MSCLGSQPRYAYPRRFEWHYSVQFMRAGSDYVRGEHYNDHRVSTHDFGLINTDLSGPNWDKATYRLHHEGKGKWLYEPAQRGSRALPGRRLVAVRVLDLWEVRQAVLERRGRADLSPPAKSTGLVILDDEQLDRLEQVREFARSMGLSNKLEHQLNCLAGMATTASPLVSACSPTTSRRTSFSFCHYMLPAYSGTGQREFSFNGGLIYQGPSCPADGSFPSLTVSLASGTGWFCHT